MIGTIERMTDYVARVFPDRALTRGATKSNWKTFGCKEDWVGQTLVRVVDLLINHSYQRDKMSPGTVNDITANFNYRIFSPIVVSTRTKCVLDGSHRTSGAIRRGIEMIPCVFVDLDGVEEEARYFLLLNKKKTFVSAIDQFRASLASGNKEALELQDIANRAGVRINKDAHEPHNCKFVYELQRSFSASKENTERALAICDRLCFSEPLHVDVFRGVFWLLNRGVDLGCYTEKIIRRGGVTAIKANYNKIKILAGNEYPAKHAGLAILEIINKGLRKKIIVDGARG